ncbi:MAG: response regulator, partial [Lachnospiraceae bacterium]|nr:response regulator [Lachnospiraceae bacterium]
MAMVHAAEKKISLVRDVDIPECTLVMDAHRFRRIMNNLIDNAIKFTKEGGTVTVTARAKETSDSGYTRYQFKVADTGIGMSEEFMKRIYGSFEREESSTKSGVSGTGLGLSITRNLIDIMGGTISVESKKGEGSVFTVALPLKAADKCGSIQKEEVSAKEEPRAEGAYRILLVEDMEINRLMAEMVLKEAGFSVVSVRDGSEAVVAMESSPVGYFDLVLMDIQMPVMNGYEATRVIRGMGREDTSDIPIIALS